MRPAALALEKTQRCLPEEEEWGAALLHRRRQRVVVRAPDAPASTVPAVDLERRARANTLVGLGYRDTLPTLPDWVTTDDVRPPAYAICELDEETTEQLLFDAECLSLTFDYRP